MEQILHGLIFLSSYDIVHRNLRPSNIFITAEGTLKIADFGYARIMDE